MFAKSIISDPFDPCANFTFYKYYSRQAEELVLLYMCPSYAVSILRFDGEKWQMKRMKFNFCCAHICVRAKQRWHFILLK